jgi:mRNA interferase MazF
VRGDIYRLRAPRGAHGHEQHGQRHVVVVQTDRFALSTVLVAPTSTSAAPAVFRPRITIDDTDTYVLVEQTSAVNSETRLGDFAGRLDASELAEVDQALRLLLGLY